MKRKKGKKIYFLHPPLPPDNPPPPSVGKKVAKSGCFTLESGGLGILTLASLCDKEEKQKYQSQILP